MSADGVTALNIAIPIYSLIHGTGLMIGMGGATSLQYTKVRDVTKQEAEFSPVHCLWLWCLERYTFGQAFFSMPLAKLLGAKGSVVGMTNTYLKVLMMFGPFLV